MSIRPYMTDFEKAVIAEFPLRLRALPGNTALRERRKRAFAYFEAEGLPSRRNEEWHYTDLKALMPASGLASLEPMAAAAADPQDPVARLSEDHLRIGRGSIKGRSGLPKGVSIYTLETAMAQRPDLFARLGEAVSDTASSVIALNTALFPDMTVLHVAAGTHVDVPLHASFFYQDGMPLRMEARALIIVENGASLTMINSVSSGDNASYQVNAVVELLVGDDAKVDIVRSSTGARASISLHTFAARLGARSKLNMFTFNAGTKISRTEVRVTFAGEHASAGIRGVGLLRGDQHNDVTLMVDHVAPHCESRELFRNIIDDQATGVFQGKIMVKKDAQKTDGQMASNAILLSDDAVMNNKPELEIFADDVLCAHGATCGALDDDLLFYLQARGLPKAEAESLMIQAFCGEAIEFVENEPVRDALNATVETWLRTRSSPK